VACGGDDGGNGAEHGAGHGAEHTQQSSAAAFNDADVAFAQGMIPHHAQAVDMADLADDRAGDPEVRDLAQRIRAAQQPEIDLMAGWLDDWGHPMDFADNMDMGEMDMGEMGMMSDQAMERLESATGEEFDRLFLSGMREHHLGAVAMAEEELSEGESPEAKQLAQEIIDTQRAEIEEIDALLAA
ncbi:MAG: DUF305 domain-containing protein, partial [Actinobacteria bacterium]|nr:DUF305 domain-containing protein [Actinomycetota bacterium]